MMELENESQSRVLFAVLASVCSGMALSIVRSVGGGEDICSGVEAWRVLCLEYEPALARRMTMVPTC